VVGAVVLGISGPAGASSSGSPATWVSNAVIMSVLCLVIGAKLIGDAISGLTA
jgi:hypothetical protein